MPVMFVPWEPFYLDIAMNNPTGKPETKLPEKLSELMALGLSELRKLVARGGKIRLTCWIHVPDKLENCEACLAGGAMLGNLNIRAADAVDSGPGSDRCVCLFALSQANRISEQDYRRLWAMAHLSKGSVSQALQELSSTGAPISEHPLDKRLPVIPADGYVGEDWLKAMDGLQQELVEAGL